MVPSVLRLGPTELETVVRHIRNYCREVAEVVVRFYKGCHLFADQN